MKVYNDRPMCDVFWDKIHETSPYIGCRNMAFVNLMLILNRRIQFRLRQDKFNNYKFKEFK